MTFLHPLLLGAGLACVSIPILIHFLMRRRRKPVRWAAMRFVIEAYRRQRRRMRLEQILLLVVRCVLVALIAFGLGRPMMARAGLLGSGSRDIYFLIDNSLAAGAEEGGQEALSRSLAAARRQLGELDASRGDRAAVVLLGGPASALVLPATSDLALVDRTIASVTATDGGMDLAGGVALIRPLLSEEIEAVDSAVAVLSGFRAGSVGAAPPLESLGVPVIATAPSETELANIGIDSVALLRPVMVTGGGDLPPSAQVRVGLVRSGSGLDGSGVSSVRVHGSGAQPIGSAEVRWGPGQERAQSIVDVDLAGEGEGGRVVLRASIDRDDNERDNESWVVLRVRDRLRIGVVGTRRFGVLPRIESFTPSDWLRLALDPADGAGAGPVGVEVLDAPALSADRVRGFDALVVAEPERLRAEGWGAIGGFVKSGGALLLVPGAGVGAQLWGETATRELGLAWGFEREPVESDGVALRVLPIDGEDPLWFVRGELEELVSGVRVDRVLPTTGAAGAKVLLETEDGRALLVVDDGREGEGRVMFLASAPSLAWTNLPARPLMVPLMQELVRSAIGSGLRAAGGYADGRLRAPLGAVELRALTEVDSSAPAVGVDPSTGMLRRPVRHRGVYQAADARGVVMGTVTVAPVAAAGDVATVGAESVARWLGGLAGSDEAFAWVGETGERESGVAEARASASGAGLALLLAALIVACIEVALARWVSHATVPAGGSA